MKMLIILLSAVILHNTATACSVCACSGSNQYLGILPQTKSNFASIQYQHRAFSSMHHAEAGETIPNKSEEIYQTLQLSGRYSVAKKIQLFAFIPYVSNTHIENTVSTTFSGIGDITVLANYKLVGANCSEKNWLHTLLVGVGAKVPVKKYTGDMPNMQPGTSTYDFIVNTNYTILYKKAGINTDASYTQTTANADNYKFGNRLAIGLSGFYSIKLGGFKLLPQIGGRFDFSGSDYDNYQAKIKNDMSGGSQIYGSVGMLAYYKAIGIQAIFQQPVYQNYAGGMVNTKYKLETGLYFLF